MDLFSIKSYKTTCSSINKSNLGGLEKDEVDILKQAGAKIVTLGRRILRTETAPIVIASILMYEFDEMKI